MKITRISAENFLGIRNADVVLDHPVTLFAGQNFAGKSSLQEAVRMALCGEAVRVDLKKEYPALVHDQAKAGGCSVTVETAVASIALPSGKASGFTPPATLPYVLDAQRFARLDTKERRAFLFGLMGLQVTPAAVKERLAKRGCDAKKVEQVLPLLRAALDARAARDARDARDALDALHHAGRGSLWRFAAWCIQAYGWGYWRFDLSWVSTTHFGATTQEVRAWSTPLFEAYVAGCWTLHWTDDTLYWVAKPTMHVERTAQGARRLHNESYAALESDVENLYFWHGVLVPAFVVVRPDWITLKHVESETNAEVRRIMVERYGYERYLRESKAELIDSCGDDHELVGMRTAKLWRIGDITMLDLLNSTPEPDGSVKRYVIPIDADRYDGRAGRECIAASASTWRRRGDPTQLAFARPEDYAPAFES